METSEKNKSKQFAFTFTVGIHLLLFLFFLFTGFMIPEKVNSAIVESKGGLSMEGYQFVEMDAIIPSPSSQSSPKLISDPNEMDVKLEKMNTVAKFVSVDAPVDSEYETILKNWSTRKKSLGQNKNSVGDDLKSNTDGALDGKKGGIEIDGTFILVNRLLIQKPEAILNSSVEGKVVVEIIVNQEGKVTRAIPGQRGSTTTSKLLYDKAVKAAYSAKFNPTSDGIKEQRGTYTFVFTLE